MTFMEHVYPVVLRRARLVFRERGPEEREELTAEAVCVALDGFRSIQRRRKKGVTAKSIAFYSVRRAGSGRKIASSDSKNDAMHHVTHDVDDLPEDLIHNLTREDDNPSDLAALRIDFPAYLRTVNTQKRRACRLFLDGHGNREVSRRLHVTQGRVSQLRRELFEGYYAFTL
jgi:hypothetical protein